MILYDYKVHDANDKTVRSYCHAASEAALRTQLRSMGYTIDSIAQKTMGRIFSRRTRIKSQDIVSMCRRFSIMYSAGLNLLDCLSSLSRENESRELSDILRNIHDTIAGGEGVADAFARYPKVFSPFFINMIRAGEATGKFAYILGELAAYVEKQQELKRTIRSALAYPLMVLVMIILVVTAIVMFVVPVFSDVYARLGIALPGPTLTLISISDNAAYFIPSVFVALGLIWIANKKIQKIPLAKLFVDRIKLDLPLIGKVYRRMVLLRFIRTLSLAVSAGIPLSHAVPISSDVASNGVISSAAQMIERSINHGGTITDAIKLHGFFPQSILHAFSRS